MLIKGPKYREARKEKILSDISFNIFKFNNRPKPGRKQILFVTCFSEFGCESLALMYCLPRLLQKYPGMYVICVGWYGREYLYRHLVDEYWEIKEENQWLREHCNAFHHTSRNLDQIEKSLAKYGNVYLGRSMGHYILGNLCKTCKHFWGDHRYTPKCPKCESLDLERSLFSEISKARETVVKIPRPSQVKLDEAKKYLPSGKAVGIFARGRKMYGRNLTPEFYIKLIGLLEQLDYHPIWLGEKQSVLPCPVDHIVDFSRLPEAKDLELTLAIISQLEFTVQFWTASTRLAAMMGVPYLLFESPDQICGNGQEGLRMAMTSDYDKKKLVLAHYLSVVENNDVALQLVEQSITEMKQNNWDNIYGFVENEQVVQLMLENKNVWGK